jgi:hypothetical protein
MLVVKLRAFTTGNSNFPVGFSSTDKNNRQPTEKYTFILVHGNRQKYYVTCWGAVHRKFIKFSVGTNVSLSVVLYTHRKITCKISPPNSPAHGTKIAATFSRQLDPGCVQKKNSNPLACKVFGHQKSRTCCVKKAPPTRERVIKNNKTLKQKRKKSQKIMTPPSPAS